eukprot:GHVS01091055.1.p1 GENE.GHVS01091055.1~~GHVS01091055.1.p1  ORF type:complete len:293 (+),score=68.43 GHVS01091055.1:128-880(+)
MLLVLDLLLIPLLLRSIGFVVSHLRLPALFTKSSSSANNNNKRPEDNPSRPPPQEQHDAPPRPPGLGQEDIGELEALERKLEDIPEDPETFVEKSKIRRRIYLLRKEKAKKTEQLLAERREEEEGGRGLQGGAGGEQKGGGPAALLSLLSWKPLVGAILKALLLPSFKFLLCTTVIRHFAFPPLLPLLYLPAKLLVPFVHASNPCASDTDIESNWWSYGCDSFILVYLIALVVVRYAKRECLMFVHPDYP